MARKLGYANWADFQTEIKMAKTGARAEDFLEQLKAGLQPKFDAETAEFRAMKAKETGDTNAQIHLVGLALLRQSTQEGKIHRGRGGAAGLFPLPKRPGGDVPDLPAHFRPEIPADRSALQVGPGFAALRRLRCRHRRTAGLVLSRHVPARRQIQSFRRIQHH